MTGFTFDEDRALLDSVPALPQEEQAAALERLLRSPSHVIREAAARVGAALLSDDDIVRHLRARDDDVLRNAALEMLKLRGRATQELGIALLRDRDPDVVLQAVMLLDHLKDPLTLEALRGALEHPNANVVQAAIVAIGHIGHSGAAADLFPFLKADNWLRIAAIQALGDLRLPASVAPLAELLPDTTAGSLSAESIARIGGEDAFVHLANHWVESGAADDHMLQLVAHVLEGLNCRPPEPTTFHAALLERMVSGTTTGRSAAARCLLVLGPGKHDRATLEVLATDIGNTTTLPACLTRRPDLIDTLITMHGTQRTWGFLLVAEYPKDVTVEALEAALSDCPAHEHLGAIADAFARIAGPEFTALLLQFYCRVPPDARSVLAPYLRRKRTTVRKALDSLDENGCTKSLLRALLADDTQETVAAILDLPPDAQLEVIPQLEDDVEALRQLPWIRWLTEQPTVYGSVAVKYAEQAGLSAMLPTIRGLLSKTPHANLVRLVETLGDVDSVPLLIGLIEEHDQKIQPFVLGALGTLGGPDARRALSEAAVNGDPRWRRFAFRALGQCLTEAEEHVFRDGSRDDDWHVRLISAQVLCRSGRSTDFPILARLAADPVAAVAQCARSALGQ